MKTKIDKLISSKDYVLLLGLPASGKGTLCKKLVTEKNLHHIATGDILRDHIKRGTKYGLLARELEKEGKLMPNSQIIEIVNAELNQHILSPDNNGLVLDGVVRTVEQAKHIVSVFKEMDLHLNVVCIEVEDSIVFERVMARNAEGQGRVDDSDRNIVQNRINIYNESIEGILEVIETEFEVNYINGEQSVEDVYKDCIAGVYSKDIVYSYNYKDLIRIYRTRGGKWFSEYSVSTIAKHLNNKIKQRSDWDESDLYSIGNTSSLIDLGIVINSQLRYLFTRCQISYGDIKTKDDFIEKYLPKELKEELL